MFNAFNVVVFVVCTLTFHVWRSKPSRGVSVIEQYRQTAYKYPEFETVMTLIERLQLIGYRHWDLLKLVH